MEIKQVRNFVLNHLAARMKLAGISAEQLADDDDLISLGLLDSLGFVTLITTAEDCYQVRLPLDELGIAELSTISGLMRAISSANKC